MSRFLWLWRVLVIISSNNLGPFHFPLSETLIMCVLDNLIGSYKSFRLCLPSFFLSAPQTWYFQVLYFKFLWFFFFACSHMLLNPSSDFFNSVIMFFSSRVSFFPFYNCYLFVKILSSFIYFSLLDLSAYSVMSFKIFKTCLCLLCSMPMFYQGEFLNNCFVSVFLLLYLHIIYCIIF